MVAISVVKQVFLESKTCDIRGIVRLLIITFIGIVPLVLDGIFEVHGASVQRQHTYW